MSEAVYLGIDLGTSRTSVTSSLGLRETVWSFVGYPKDHVAMKKFGGRSIIYGKEAVDNRLALNLHRPLAGGSIKVQGAQDSGDTKTAVKDLLEHIVAIANVPKEKNIFAVIGAPAEASTAGKGSILEAAKNCMDAVIVCSEPFAVAYGLDFLDDTLVIDIGAGTVDLCRVHGTMPTAEDQRTHNSAGDFVDKTIAEKLTKALPDAQFSINMIKTWKEKYATLFADYGDEGRTIVNIPHKGKPIPTDITTELYHGCMTMIPPTIEALQDLIATYDPEFQEKMRSNVLLGGGGSRVPGLGRAIERGLEEYGGGNVTTVEEPQYAGSNGALKVALDMPEEYWKEFKKAF